MNDIFKNMKVPTKILFCTKQKGFSSLLFIVLVGLSLTVLTVGYMSSMRNLQSSATTAHAQTQAQMQSMIGYQALGEFLKAQSLANIAKIQTGTISGGTTPIQFKKIACGTNQYCFDIVGKSGGASAILRSQYALIDIIKASSQEGSLFAGGLKVQDASSLQSIGDNVSISVGKTILKNGTELAAGDVYDNSGVKVSLTGITVNEYKGGLNLASVSSLKEYANYIFTHDSNGNIFCEKQNLNQDNGSFTCPTTAQGLTYASSGNNKGFTVDTAKLINNNFNFRGVLWFDDDVRLQVAPSDISQTSKKYMWRNTVLTTGKLYIAKDASSSSGELNIFSPFDYVMASDISQKIIELEIRIKVLENKVRTDEEETELSQKIQLKTNSITQRLSVIKERLKNICPVFKDNPDDLAAEYPTQFCKVFTKQDLDKIITYEYFKENYTNYMKDVKILPASLADIIALSDFGFSITADQNTKTNLYGNLIGSKAAGNTGNASGKFAGTGVINVIGNLVVADEMDLTEMQGNVSIKLGQTKSGGNYIPIIDQSLTAKGIRYM